MMNKECACNEPLNEVVDSPDKTMKSCPSCSDKQEQHISHSCCDKEKTDGTTEAAVMDKNNAGDHSCSTSCGTDHTCSDVNTKA